MLSFDDLGPEKILRVYDAKTGMKGMIVIDNTAFGPGKGGIRMTPDVSVEEVAKLARAMTLKNAIAELPFGGGKSGIVADAKKLTPKKKAAIVESFAKAIKEICPSIYVAAPDISMAEGEMAIIAKTLGTGKAVTGKPANMCEGYSCGIPHELGSTGYGVFLATNVALKHCGMDMKGVKVAVEGFGNVGSFAAKFLTEAGAVLVATSDSKGAIFDSEGLDVERLIKLKSKRKSVVDYKAKKIDDIVSADCDVFIPAAKPDVIHEKNKDGLKAKIIVEGANIPMSAVIEEEYYKKKVLVVPDFVANAGGVISSYVEYIGGPVEDVFPMIERKIAKNTKLVLEKSKSEKISPRKTAFKIAIDRIKHAKL